MGRRRKNLAYRWEAPAGWKAADGCTILGCGRKGIARGMCWAHYARARRGAPVTVFLATARSGAQKRLITLSFGPARPPKSVRRMARIAWEIANDWTPEPNTGCSLWLGNYNPNGYGYIGRCGDPWGGWAHRAVLYFNGESLKRGHAFHVRHKCNNPACVNPDHVTYGTAKENMADRTLRYRSGELPPLVGNKAPRKLTPSLVAYIREAHALGASKAELARDLSLHWNTVALAVRRAA